MTTQMIVKAGSCMDNFGDGRVCALQPMDCPTGTSFVTPRMLEQGGGGGTAHGGACATKDGTENTAKIGSCTDGTKNGFCASDASLCADPQAFVPVDDRCTIRVDRLQQNNGHGTTTLFGKCMVDDTCYWSHKDCEDSSSWEAADDSCPCEKVRVGACVDTEGLYYCAVSEEACSSVGTWIDAFSLMRYGSTNAPDCFLCRQDNVEPIQGTATTTNNNNNNPPSNEGSSNDTTITKSGGGTTSNNTAMIAGVVAGGGGTILILMFVLMLYRRQRMVGPTHNKTVSDIPVETITDTSAHNQDIEELSMDGGI